MSLSEVAVGKPFLNDSSVDPINLPSISAMILSPTLWYSFEMVRAVANINDVTLNLRDAVSARQPIPNKRFSGLYVDTDNEEEAFCRL